MCRLFAAGASALASLLSVLLQTAVCTLPAHAAFYDPSIVGFPCEFKEPDPKVCGGDPSKTAKPPATSWQGFVVGARIQF
jgi:hypothetical protein